MSLENNRGTSITSVWQASCKDCVAEQMSFSKKKKKSPHEASLSFEYSDRSASRSLETGNTRSDRCERHRRSHRHAIRALAVAYVDLKVLGEVADPMHPNGPLGGLGRLPIVHKRREHSVVLDGFSFGMSDEDVLTILDGLKDKKVAVVEAGTGTGKSTFMPFRIMNPPLEAQMNLTKSGPIVVTEPRRAAATGVARFVGEELCFGHNSQTCDHHVGSGYPVGYQVSDDKNWDSACDLIYVTDGTMINWIRDGRLSKIGLVIIDEAHERSENIDIILAQLREKINEFKHLRVIITSATIDSDFFISYFGGPEKVFHYSVPEKKAFGYGVPLFVGADINDDILVNGLTIGSATDGDNNSLTYSGWEAGGAIDNHSEQEDLRGHTVILEKLRCVDKMPFDEWKENIPKKTAMELMPKAVAKQVCAIANGTDWGDILAFLPTRDLIVKAIKLIEEQLLETQLEFDVYPLLGSEPEKKIKQAIAARSRGDKRKIVVSSNLAETSLTVSGVRYIVDSGLICQSTWDHDLVTGSLPTKPHSQSGLRQRWGRVGRDSPGWVFPLYTSEQFLALPKDTPPGSTRVNLEAFSMKLIAAGIDLNETPLPAGFVPEAATFDAASQQNIANFNKELKRAQNTLSKIGATDSDGHLTEFGRDLDRFRGEGTHGLALMLADQMACVHEVAFALEVIANGLLVGHGDNCILRINRKWPSAWRVAAAKCHRGLAVGCEDDLDLLLRVLSHWQKSDEPDQWCRTWWVNGSALRKAEAAVKQTVKLLSAAIKGEAWRDIELSLSNRAKAVLTHALSGYQFEKVDDNLYRLFSSEESEIVELSRSLLVQPGPKFLALQRYRRAASNTDGNPRPIISHTINCVPWVNLNEPSGDNLGLQMVIQSVQNLRDIDGTLKLRKDPLRLVRDFLPIGSLIVAKLGQPIGGIYPFEVPKIINGPFLMPDAAVFDVSENLEENIDEYDTWHRSDAEIPEEEQALQVQNPRDNEVNGVGFSKKQTNGDEHKSLPSSAFPSLSMESAFESIVLERQCKVLVTGYRILDDNNIVLVVELMAAEFVNGDPAQFNDLIPWQKLKLVVRGRVKDHEFEFVQLDRIDGMGCFFLDANNGGGLNYFDYGYLSRLAIGAEIHSRVVAHSHNPISITLRPWAKELLGLNMAKTLKFKGKSVRYFEAVIVKDTNDKGYVTVEVQHENPDDGHSQRFEVEAKLIEQDSFIKNELGQKLLIALEADRRRNRTKLKLVTIEALEYAEQYNSGLRVRDGNILPPNKEISFTTIGNLLKIHDDFAWSRSVWQFFYESMCLCVVDIRPMQAERQIETSDVVVSLLKSRRNDVAFSLGVQLITSNDNIVKITALNLEAVEDARAELGRLSALKYMIIHLPEGAAKLTVDMLKEAESIPQIVWIWKAENRVTILGETAAAVKEAVSLVGLLTCVVLGELIVPEGTSGKLIGINGKDIKVIQAVTGCAAQNQGRGNRWIIKGPSVSAVNEFIRLAKELVGGGAGHVDETVDPIVIFDRTGACLKNAAKMAVNLKPTQPNCSSQDKPEQPSEVTSAPKPTSKKPADMTVNVMPTQSYKSSELIFEQPNKVISIPKTALKKPADITVNVMPTQSNKLRQHISEQPDKVTLKPKPIEQSNADARYYLAIQGDAVSQYDLAVLYSTGNGVEQDNKKAFSWFEKSAIQGNPDAQLKLGELFAFGKHVEQDDRKAFSWFEKSAVQGNAQAQSNLAFMYEEGYGVEQDDKKALIWYEKSALQGNLDARIMLSSIE